MKTQTIARMLRRRFMTNRCELTVRCSAEMFTRIVVPMRLYHTIGSVRSVEHRRGVLRVLVKVFDDDHERTHLTARALRRAFVALRRAGVTAPVRVTL